MRLNSLAIKKLMVEKGMSIKALSNLSGISRQSVSTILARGTCSIVNAGRIAAALQVKPEEIWKEE